MLGAHEAEHLPEVARGHDVFQQRALLVAGHFVDALRDGLGGGIAPGDLDQLRLVQQGIGELFDLVGERRRKEQILAPRSHRQERHDALDVGDEPHVEHPIRFIENEDLDLT